MHLNLWNPVPSQTFCISQDNYGSRRESIRLYFSEFIETTGSLGLLQRGDQFYPKHQFQQVEHGRYCQVCISSYGFMWAQAQEVAMQRFWEFYSLCWRSLERLRAQWQKACISGRKGQRIGEQALFSLVTSKRNLSAQYRDQQLSRHWREMWSLSGLSTSQAVCQLLTL